MRKNIAILLIILIYILFFGLISSLRQYNFQTQTSDMGIFVQNMWNTAHGRIMQNTLEELPNHFAIHMSPFLLLIAPFYRICDSPYFLLWIQTVAIAIGALPLYLSAKNILRSSAWALAIASAYLLYPSTQWMNLYDFHSISFLPTLLFAALYFVQTNKLFWASIFLVLASATQEDAILVVAFFALWLFSLKSFKNTVQWEYKKVWTYGIALCSLVYFVIAIKILMPAFGGGLLRLDRYSYLGNNFSEITKNLFTNPYIFIRSVFATTKLIYLVWLFAPVAFLPILAPHALLLLIPGLLENMLTNYAFQFQGLYQYDAVVIAGIFIGVVFGIEHILKKWSAHEKKFLRIFIFISLFAFLLRSPVSPISFPTDLFKNNPHWDTLRRMVNTVPPNASVSANTNIVPHLANREHIYLLGREPFPVDIVLIDGADLFGFKTSEEFQAYADSYALSGKYEIRSINERYFIFVRKQ